MSKAFIAATLKDSTKMTQAAANRTAGDLIDAIARELKRKGKFSLPTFGTFIVRKTRARNAADPRTGEAIRVKAGKTVRFKVSPVLRGRI